MSCSTPQVLELFEPQDLFSIEGVNTDVTGINYSLLWTIHKFSSYQRNENISSAKFCIDQNNDLEASLLIYPRGMEGSEVDRISIYLQFSTMSITEQDKFKTSVVFELYTPGAGSTRTGTIATSKVILETCTFREGFGWGTENLAPTSSVINANYQSARIFCKIFVVTDKKNKETVTSKIAKQDLLRSVASMYADELLTDVSFVIGEEKLPAHRAMLAARSEVFRAMFHSDMTEVASNIVNITDASVDAFKAMLIFIYTGEMDSLDTLAEELLCLAEKYALTDLKDKCVRSLVKCLSMENALHILVLADRFRAVRLKEQAYGFYSKEMKKL